MNFSPIIVLGYFVTICKLKITGRNVHCDLPDGVLTDFLSPTEKPVLLPFATHLNSSLPHINPCCSFSEPVITSTWFPHVIQVN